MGRLRPPAVTPAPSALDQNCWAASSHPAFPPPADCQGCVAEAADANMDSCTVRLPQGRNQQH